jgi:hypothetical protein
MRRIIRHVHTRGEFCQIAIWSSLLSPGDDVSRTRGTVTSSPAGPTASMAARSAEASTAEQGGRGLPVAIASVKASHSLPGNGSSNRVPREFRRKK